MKKFFALFMAGAALMLGGCGEDGGANNTLTKVFVGPKTAPIWLAVRQANEVQQNYNMTVPQAEEAAKAAVTATGGYVRYVTEVGNSRTIYARTSDEKHIVIDVDPARNGQVTVDVCVDMYGNKGASREILAAMPTLASAEAPAAPCPAEGCDK